MPRRTAVLGILLGLIVALIHPESFAETSEVTDPDLAKEISYLTLAVRDRYCMAQLTDIGEGMTSTYANCMRKNEKVSYCKARQVDFEELAVMMAASKKLEMLLPLDRLVQFVSARCIEVDGFVPPPLPLVKLEQSSECSTFTPVLLAYAASLHLPTEPSEENTDKRLLCESNVGLSFLDEECNRGFRGFSFSGHTDFCSRPIKPVRKVNQ